MKQGAYGGEAARQKTELHGPTIARSGGNGAGSDLNVRMPGADRRLASANTSSDAAAVRERAGNDAEARATCPKPAGQRKASGGRGFGGIGLPGHRSMPIAGRQGRSRRRAQDTWASFRIGLAWSAVNTIMLGASPRWD